MPTRRLSRNMIDRTFGGVCGGLGDYLGINGWWVRLTFILFAFFTLGVSVLIYIVLWLLIPQQTLPEVLREADQPAPSPETLVLLGGGLVILGMAVLAVSLEVLEGTRGNVLLPLMILSLGVVLLAQQLRKSA